MPSITIARDVLAIALAELGRVIDRRFSVPVLTCVLVRPAGADAVSLVGTDLEMEMTITAPATCEPGATGGLVPAHMLAAIIKPLPKGAEVRLVDAPHAIPGAAGDMGDGLRIVSGPSGATLQGMPMRDFPSMGTGEPDHVFTVGGADLADVLARVSFAMSTEATRYYLNGMHVHAVRDAPDAAPILRAVTTDGHRLAMRDFKVIGDAAGLPGMIVPRATCHVLAKALAASAKAGGRKAAPSDVAFTIMPTRDAPRILAEMELGSARLRLVAKTIDGTFPDYMRVVPRANPRTLRVDAAALAGLVDRVSSVSSERGRAVGFYLESGRLTAAVTNPDAGRTSETLAVDYDGEPLSIGFNARYVLDILAALRADDVTIRLADAGSPARFEATGDADGFAVLMPMNIGDYAATVAAKRDAEREEPAPAAAPVEPPAPRVKPRVSVRAVAVEVPDAPAPAAPASPVVVPFARPVSPRVAALLGGASSVPLAGPFRALPAAFRA